jgi:hypothetical protein
MPKRNDPHNYQVTFQHESQERPTRQSFASSDTAWGWARRAFEAGATTARLVRKTDGRVLWDGPAGIDVDWREW